MDRHSFRLRIGDMRIIYSVDEDKQIVYIEVIGFRGDVYKNWWFLVADIPWKKQKAVKDEILNCLDWRGFQDKVKRLERPYSHFCLFNYYFLSLSSFDKISFISLLARLTVSLSPFLETRLNQ